MPSKALHPPCENRRVVSLLAELRALDNEHLNPLFTASVFATEEAIINAMIAAEDMTGHHGFSVKALPQEALKKVMKI